MSLTNGEVKSEDTSLDRGSHSQATAITRASKKQVRPTTIHVARSWATAPTLSSVADNNSDFWSTSNFQSSSQCFWRFPNHTILADHIKWGYPQYQHRNATSSVSNY